MLSDYHKAQGRHQEGSNRQGPVPGRVRLVAHFVAGRKEGVMDLIIGHNVNLNRMDPHTF